MTFTDQIVLNVFISSNFISRKDASKYLKVSHPAKETGWILWGTESGMFLFKLCGLEPGIYTPSLVFSCLEDSECTGYLKNIPKIHTSHTSSKISVRIKKCILE